MTRNWVNGPVGGSPERDALTARDHSGKSANRSMTRMIDMTDRTNALIACLIAASVCPLAAAPW